MKIGWFVLSMMLACGGRAAAQGVVLDVDLTQGLGALPPGAKVIGGEWGVGWRVTGNHQRLVLDPGYAIKNGVLEVTFTRAAVLDTPVAYAQPAWLWNAKILGIYEGPDLGKEAGDVFRFEQGGQERFRNLQGVVQARLKEQGTGRNSIWGQNIGKWTDWTVDDRTPMSVKFEWRGGTGTFTDIKGNTVACPKNCNNQLDSLRYVSLGGDNSTSGGAIGVRFLRAKLTDLDKSAAASPAVVRKRIVFDVDLTKGPDALPPQAMVIGAGEWDQGWRVTADHQRVVFDAGYQIRNGSMEVTLTRKKHPYTSGKIDMIGLYEMATLDHADTFGDTFYLRVGTGQEAQDVMGAIKAHVKERIQQHFGEIWQQQFGTHDDWATDDKTPITVKFEWRDGIGAFVNPKGERMACPKDCGGKNLNSFRFAALGGDRYDGAPSLVGARFLRMKLVDLDAPED